MSKRSFITLFVFALCILLTPNRAMAMQIFAHHATHTYTLDVEPSDSIENVKTKIQDLAGYSPDSQMLSYGSSTLQDGNTLSDYSIAHDSTLELTLIPSLIAHWTMDESSGGAMDTSGSGLNLTNQGSVSRTQGVFGNAASFNGSNNFSGTGPNIASSSFSVSSWLYADDFVNEMVWLSIGSVSDTSKALHLRMYDNGTMLMGFFLDDLTANGFSNHAWHHVVYTFDVDTGLRQIYLDNQLMGSDFSAPFIGDNSMAIGDWNGFEHWHGKIDDVRVYDQSLSSAEIGSLYNAGETSLAALNSSGGCSTATTIIGSIISSTKCGVTTTFDTSPQSSLSVPVGAIINGSVATSTSLSISISIPIVPSASTSSPAVSISVFSSLAASSSAEHRVSDAFARDLSYRAEGHDVLMLQEFLKARGFFAVVPNGYFGLLTKAAVAKYQKENGIHSTGYFGPVTRAFIKSQELTAARP